MHIPPNTSYTQELPAAILEYTQTKLWHPQRRALGGLRRDYYSSVKAGQYKKAFQDRSLQTSQLRLKYSGISVSQPAT